MISIAGGYFYLIIISKWDLLLWAFVSHILDRILFCYIRIMKWKWQHALKCHFFRQSTLRQGEVMSVTPFLRARSIIRDRNYLLFFSLAGFHFSLLLLIFDIFPSFLTGSAESIVNFRLDNGCSRFTAIFPNNCRLSMKTERGKMIIFGSLLTSFEASLIFEAAGART